MSSVRTICWSTGSRGGCASAEQKKGCIRERIPAFQVAHRTRGGHRAPSQRHPSGPFVCFTQAGKQRITDPADECPLRDNGCRRPRECLSLRMTPRKGVQFQEATGDHLVRRPCSSDRPGHCHQPHREYPIQAPKGAATGRHLRADEGVKPPPRVEKQFPVGMAWTVVSLNGKSFSGERPDIACLTTFIAEPALPACNSFSATAYPLREQGFAVGPVAVTRRACDTAAMAIERSFPGRIANSGKMGSRCRPAGAERAERNPALRARHLTGTARRRWIVSALDRLARRRLTRRPRPGSRHRRCLGLFPRCRTPAIRPATPATRRIGAIIIGMHGDNIIMQLDQR